MTNFLSLPLELRQVILGYAFHNAATQDAIFGLRQRRVLEWLRNLPSHGRKYSSQLHQIVLTAIVTRNIYELAARLAYVDSEIKCDMLYPLKQTLDMFENLDEETDDLIDPIIARRECVAAKFESLSTCREKKRMCGSRELGWR